MTKVTTINKKEIHTLLHFGGDICIVLGIAMLLPIIIALIYKETNMILPFLETVAITLVIAIICKKCFKKEVKLNKKTGMIFSTLIWLAVSAIGALPYYLSGELSYFNAYFEAMSGFTTTGFTMFMAPETAGYTLNFWRALSQWLGGLGIIFMALVVIKSIGSNVTQLYNAEGREEKIAPSVKKTTKIILYLYGFFTIIGIISLILVGMPIFDSIFHMFVIISTGGFGLYSNSLYHYNSVPIEIVTIIFMIIGAINFALIYIALKGKLKSFFKDIETKVGIAIIIIATLIITGVLLKNNVYGTGIFENLRFALFQVVSAVTTTGLQTAENPGFATQWQAIGIFILSVTMIMGAGYGSTGGGIKWLRIGIILKGLYWNIKSYLLPEKTVFNRTVYHKEEKMKINNALIKGIALFIIIYLIVYGLSVMGVLFYYNNLSQACFEVASALGNVGLSSGILTPNSPILVKLIFIIDFWIGRLEIWPILLCLTIFGNSFKQLKNSRKTRKQE